MKPLACFLAFLFSLLFPSPGSSGDSEYFQYPAEWESHEALWFGFRTHETAALRQTGHRHHHDLVGIPMLRALARHVKVNVVIEDAGLLPGGKRDLSAYGIDTSRVEIFVQDSTFVWYRDVGPLFLTNGSELIVADVLFSYYANTLPSEHSSIALRFGKIDRDVARRMSLRVLESPVVLEGGSICVNGKGTLILSELTRRRNPHLSRSEIERELIKALGQKKVIWVKEGSIEDEELWGRISGPYWAAGTGGHTDEFVSFLDERTIALSWIDEDERDTNPVSRANYERMSENYRILKEATDQDGKPFEIVKIPAPDLQYDEFRLPRHNLPAFRAADPTVNLGDPIRWVATASYLNYVITNGVVLLPSFWKEGSPESQRVKDLKVARIFRRFYPGREIVRINPIALNHLGGGMHCLVQQQPAIRTPDPSQPSPTD